MSIWVALPAHVGNSSLSKSLQSSENFQEILQEGKMNESFEPLLHNSRIGFVESYLHFG